MSKLTDILDAGQQLSMEAILEAIQEEEGGPSATTESPEPHNGLPSGWMYQMGKKQSAGDALAEARARFMAKFKCEPKTIWMNPATGDDGDGVSHDGRIGKNYLLLGPLPKSQ